MFKPFREWYRQGKFEAKAITLIPFLLYVGRLRIYDYGDKREGYIYGVHITPLFAFTFTFGKQVK